MKTNEGAVTYKHSLDYAVEFFSKAGSLFENRKPFYNNNTSESALSLFQKAWSEDPYIAFKLLMWLRDCRGGAGNRSASKTIYTWLASENPDWIKSNIGWLPLLGRWDDLRCLFGTELEDVATELWVKALEDKNVLAAKWADRKDKPLQSLMDINEAELRKLLSGLRKDHIVEYKMCSDNWDDINYEHVPSVAMARYTKAFGKHDEERFSAYKESLKKGTAKVNAGVLFPHDCVRTVRNGDSDIANAQFDALPNYMNTNMKVIVIADTSGSMNKIVGGSVSACDISQSLALYCSGKIPVDNPFHKKFIAFCSEGEFKDWNDMSFSDAINDRNIFDGACGSTRIDLALDLILKTAKFFNVPDSSMPNMLIIVSDMQFHGTGWCRGDESNITEVEKCLDKWIEAGYSIPSIIYWNTDGYAGSPVTIKHKNVALVSGFSTAILNSIFSAEDLTPKGVMLKALEKYDVINPNNVLNDIIDNLK